ncbi:MAG: hypothetical protein RL322_1561, partial [Pseudomonadota bacterium]
SGERIARADEKRAATDQAGALSEARRAEFAHAPAPRFEEGSPASPGRKRAERSPDGPRRPRRRGSRREARHRRAGSALSRARMDPVGPGSPAKRGRTRAERSRTDPAGPLTNNHPAGRPDP